MYSALTYYIAKNVIDIIQVDLEKSKSARLDNPKSEEIGTAIQSRLDRCVFSNESTKILNCEINRMEENNL